MAVRLMEFTLAGDSNEKVKVNVEQITFVEQYQRGEITIHFVGGESVSIKADFYGFNV